MNEDTTSAEYTALTFKDNIHKLRLRTTFLGIITNYVRALSNLNDVEKFNVNIAQACIAHASFTQCMANPPKHNLKNSEGVSLINLNTYKCFRVYFNCLFYVLFISC